jgi:hypothetical protein
MKIQQLISDFLNFNDKKSHKKLHKKSHKKKSCKEQNYIVVNSNIVNDTCWTNDNIYVISLPIRVTEGAKLTIENNVTILLLNKTSVENVVISNPNISTATTPIELTVAGSCLIFESSSKLQAETIFVNSCDLNYTITNTSNNCGIFFCGTQSSSQYNFLNIQSNISIEPSQFNVKNIIMNNIGSFSFLVRTPPAVIPPPTNFVPYTISIQDTPGSSTATPPTSTLNGIPFNSITVVGCKESELNIASSTINNTGSNGLWTQNSSFIMNNLNVSGFQGNGLFARNSEINFTNKLNLVQNITPIFPAYAGVLINIAEIVGNKPDILPFPLNQFVLPKNLFLTSITLNEGLKLFLSQKNFIFRETVDVIENAPLTNFNSVSFVGTYYHGKILKKIIFIRNTTSNI